MPTALAPEKPVMTFATDHPKVRKAADGYDPSGWCRCGFCLVCPVPSACKVDAPHSGVCCPEKPLESHPKGVLNG